MKQIHAITLAAASAVALSLSAGIASAQTVSGADPYQQGYAAGAASQEKNSLNTYSQAYQAGEQAAQANAQNQLASQQAYNSGYQAGISETGKAQADQDAQLAYNQGAEDQAARDQDRADQAFDSGYNAAQNDDAKFP